MKRIYLSFVYIVLGLMLLNPLTYAQDALEPLPIDPKLRYGKLDNGLTYYIRHNEQPKERADFYIVQNVGSILEEENQRGLAHFLEHMAFNGSTNFPEDNMTEFTERVGIRMGENMNAYTGFDETVYMIMNAPVTDQKVVDSCLLILHDWSNFITLADSAIEKERGVIREEWRTRQDAQARIWEQQLPRLYPDSRYAERLPIGSIDVIDNFKPDELRDYYKKWYRPDLQAIIVVGDIDVDQIEAKVKTMFADIPKPVNPAERIWYPVPDNKEPLVSIATDKESSSLILYLFYKHDKLDFNLRATSAGLIDDYFINTVIAMMNSRLSELIIQADPPFIMSQAFDGDFMVSKTKGAWTMAAMVDENEIETAMDALVMEMQRAIQFGFTEAEYERAQNNILKEYETAYNERENQKNRSYTSEYVEHFTNGGYIPGIETEYAMLNYLAPNITVDDVNAFFRNLIGDDTNIAISLTGPEKSEVNYPTEEELIQMFQRANTLAVDAYNEELSDEPLIPVLPQPGKVIKTSYDPLFDVTIMELSNGAKVVLKHTEFKKDQIIMTATSPGGSSLFGDEDIYNLKVFNEVTRLGGIGNFSSTDLRKVLAGKKVSLATSLGLNTDNLNGATTPTDVETLFELIYLYFTAPRMDQDAYDSYISRLKSQLTNVELDPMTTLSDSLTLTIYGNNPRAGRLRIGDFEHISYPRIIEMYKERYADASDFIFTFVGNLEPDTLKPYIEQYIASLPGINRVESGNIQNVPMIRSGKIENRFQRKMETPKATVISLFSGTTAYNLENILTSTMLKQILDLVYTEKVRKDEGATYGVQVSSSISTFPEGQTYLQIYFDTDPERWGEMNKIIYDELERMATEGPRLEDFNKTKENIIKRHAENLQENSYWLNVIDTYYYRNYDAYTLYNETLNSITPEKIRDFTRNLLNQGNSIEVVMESE